MVETDLEDAGVLVTGASSGIGAASARSLAGAGANVALASRSRDPLEELADEIESETDARALVAPTDVTEPDDVAVTVERSVEAFGRLDVVVNNAGMGYVVPFEETSVEQYRTMMAVNCDGMFFVAQESLPHLRETAGTIVFVGSFAGVYPRPGGPVYAATKWWTRGLAHSLAGDVGRDDVGVSVINPTEVRTQFGSEAGEASEERYDTGEVTEPEEVADAVLFAARQSAPTAVQELDLYRRDKLRDF